MGMSDDLGSVDREDRALLELYTICYRSGNRRLFSFVAGDVKESSYS
jgi:hypothetical protein